MKNVTTLFAGREQIGTVSRYVLVNGQIRSILGSQKESDTLFDPERSIRANSSPRMHRGPASLSYNTSPIGNWISLQLVGVKSNRAALGAVVTLEQGSDKHEKEVRSGDGYISQNNLRLLSAWASPLGRRRS